MLTRVRDVVGAGIGLLVATPFLATAVLAIWLEDRAAPFFVAPRVGRDGRPFRMVKLRSMRKAPIGSGAQSTAGDDPRITRVGRWIRRFKLDEVPQLWNVLRGEMSLVGPRPQVPDGVARYTREERQILTVRPGVTDLASIVFADEGAILDGAADPDLRYEQIIRPWKSRMALLYVRHRPRFWLDVRILLLTALALVSRRRALAGLASLIPSLGGDEVLALVASRTDPLPEAPPPGASGIVRDLAGVV